MKVGIRAWESFGAASRGAQWSRTVDYVVEAERLGADIVWTSEGWGLDAVSTAGYLAAGTERIRIGTGIMQITARPPAVAAMAALTLAGMSGNRFVLGLGMSNPQVVEGLHNTRFAEPLARLREYLAILRLAFAGEPLEHHGRHYDLPLPDGEGKTLTLSRPSDDIEVPIHLATLGPKAMQLTGALADGWIGQSFTPEGSAGFVPFLEDGASRAGRSLADLELTAGGDLEFSDDVDALVDARRHLAAFRLGAMGSARTNFYTDAYERGEFGESARTVQRLWLEGKHDEARAAVPADLILHTHFLGTPEMVKARVRAHRAAGITTLRVEPKGKRLQDRLEALGQMIEIVREVG